MVKLKSFGVGQPVVLSWALSYVVYKLDLIYNGPNSLDVVSGP